MSFPSYSTIRAIANVNIGLNSKIVFLPPASTVLGQTFTICDIGGLCGLGNNIFVSTIGVDKLDNTSTILTFTNPYQSLRVFAFNTSNYAVLQNNTNANAWTSQ